MKLLDKLFADNTGKYVIAQPPNLPIYMAGVAWVIKTMVGHGAVHNMADFIFGSSVFMWGYLEIRFGESLFRRVLGGVVVAVVIVNAAR